jgi:hypothetical protein
VPSPDKQLDAVLVESGAGATTSFWYDVYVVKAGEGFRWSKSSAYLYGAVRNSNAYGANLKWEAPDILVVEYMNAGETKQEAPTVSVSGRSVRVTLRDGVMDAKAPPGGMLYNLRGRPYDRS